MQSEVFRFEFDYKNKSDKMRKRAQVDTVSDVLSGNVAISFHQADIKIGRSEFICPFK